MIKKLLAVYSIFLLSVIPAAAQDISGSWSWNSKEGSNMFTIDLIQANENDFRGNHCSVFLSGDRIDCNDTKDEFTVVLVKKAENIFQGSIRSGYSYATGNVHLQFLPEENTMLFTLKTAPKGEYYMPIEARLVRN
ncbi:MAG TPA: hypothetical protein VLN46_03325 [Gillisia sp.]|nr:hypothetical protein [Gillisia sp.]